MLVRLPGQTRALFVMRAGGRPAFRGGEIATQVVEHLRQRRCGGGRAGAGVRALEQVAAGLGLTKEEADDPGAHHEEGVAGQLCPTAELLGRPQVSRSCVSERRQHGGAAVGGVGSDRSRRGVIGTDEVECTARGGQGVGQAACPEAGERRVCEQLDGAQTVAPGQLGRRALNHPVAVLDRPLVERDVAGQGLDLDLQPGLPAATSSLAATHSSGPSVAPARCQARRSAVSGSLIAVASARCAARRSAGEAAW